MTTLLFTGGTGYIGSHAVVTFQEAGYEIVILDDLSNSREEVLSNIMKITGKKPLFYKGDFGDKRLLREIFNNHKIDGVIHFAGYKAVGESCTHISKYHQNNIGGSIQLFGTMQEFGIKNLIFSSSATVYDTGCILPLRETSKEATTNPYGTTKWVIEKLLRDFSLHAGWNVINLRYFNPIGAHPSGIIGEYPEGIPNNLMPYILQVIMGKRKELHIYGGDYPTPDGTGIRDYIHVCDLVLGHLSAFEYILKNVENNMYEVCNLGTGKGTSVLEILKITEQVLGKKIPYKITDRRSGDVAEMYCDTKKAEKLLGFIPQYTITDAITHSLRETPKNTLFKKRFARISFLFMYSSKTELKM